MRHRPSTRLAHRRRAQVSRVTHRVLEEVVGQRRQQPATSNSRTLSHTGRVVTPRLCAAISRIGQCHRNSEKEMAARNWKGSCPSRRSTPQPGLGRAPGNEETRTECRDGHERPGVHAEAVSRRHWPPGSLPAPAQDATAAQTCGIRPEVPAVHGDEPPQSQLPAPGEQREICALRVHRGEHDREAHRRRR